ncbi:hypothetical protein Glove_606g81 [Diversispora epigaea]|uniref:Uncharacterized protein n=1 Tax=Diversispora epigaea TaxID=1348612 RepID=A0A397GF85_9GLOM|nr:hypothetical protein Glove_606g81 [Diversispora epigaea]
MSLKEVKDYYGALSKRAGKSFKDGLKNRNTGRWQSLLPESSFVQPLKSSHLSPESPEPPESPESPSDQSLIFLS